MPVQPLRVEVRRALATCIIALLSVTSAGCSPKAAPTATTSACGTLPSHAPQDPGRTLAGVTRTATYNGWPYALKRSALADWKPKGKAPYTVGVLYDGNTIPFQATSFQALQGLLRRSPIVGKVIAVAAEPNNPTKQVQAYQSMIDQGADLIVLQPTSAPAFVGRIRAALQRGVATVAIISVVDDPAVVNYAPNVHTSAGAALAEFVKLLGGKGNLLGVHGVRAGEDDRSTWVSFHEVLALCPGIKLVGEIDGNYAPPAVRAAVLQFLATHPGKIDGVFDTAVMGPSIIGAFQQAGRPVPPVTAMAAQKGELAYWAAHTADGYTSTGFAGGAAGFADATARIALRILAGQGPKSDMIPWPQPPINNANLQKYVQPGWTLETPGDVEQPKDTYWSDQDLDSLFTHPERKPTA